MGLAKSAKALTFELTDYVPGAEKKVRRIYKLTAETQSDYDSWFSALTAAVN